MPDSVLQESEGLEDAEDRAGTTSRYMGNPSQKDFGGLRQIFDGNDRVMRGVSTHGKVGSRHAERVANISITDPWSLDVEQVRLLLLKVFPKAFPKPGMKRDRRQRKRARLWTLIIQHYFREGRTAGRIAMRLYAKRVRKKFELLKHPKRARTLAQEEKRVEDTIRRIRKAAAGLRTTGKPRTKGSRLKIAQLAANEGFKPDFE